MYRVYNTVRGPIDILLAVILCPLVKGFCLFIADKLDWTGFRSLFCSIWQFGLSLLSNSTEKCWPFDSNLIHLAFFSCFKGYFSFVFDLLPNTTKLYESSKKTET